MHPHPAIEAFQKEHELFLQMADEIRHALEQGQRGAQRALARRVQEFASTDLRHHMDEEESVLLDVIREHLGDAHPAVIEEDEAMRRRMEDDLQALRRSFKSGRRAHDLLEDMEEVLRDYVAYEEDRLLPWAQEMLGDSLMAEVDARYREHLMEPAPETQADLEALMAQ